MNTRNTILTLALLLVGPALAVAQTRSTGPAPGANTAAPTSGTKPAAPPSSAPQAAPAPSPNAVAPTVGTSPALTNLPPDYVIGPDDILQLMFWREKEMSVEVAVRPDGMISIPLVNDVSAAGLTPDQLREKVMQEARRYTQDAAVTVVVKQINRDRKSVV